MRFGRRRKKKEKQRAAWDAVAATLEPPPPTGADDLPAAARPADEPPPPAAEDAVAPVAPPQVPEPVAPMAPGATAEDGLPTPAPPSDAAPPAPPVASPDVEAELPAPVATADAPPPAPPVTPPDAAVPAPPVAPPPPSRPPLFRFTPTGTTEVPTATPAPPDEPGPPPLALVPEPTPEPGVEPGVDDIAAPVEPVPAVEAPPAPVEPAPEPIEPAPEPIEPAPEPIEPAPEPVAPAPEPVTATAEPVAPTADSEPTPVAPAEEPGPALATAPPLPRSQPLPAAEPVTDTEPAPDPPAPPRAPDPHSTLPVVVAPASHRGASTPAPASAPGLPAPTGRMVTVPRSTRAIADRMRHALDDMAQLSMRMDAWMDQAVEMRTQLLSEWDDDTLRPSYTDFVVRAVARALVQHPELNAIVRGDSIELLPRVHVGITLPGRDGIAIPVVHDADRRTLRTIAAASLGIDDPIAGQRALPAGAPPSSTGLTWRAPDDDAPDGPPSSATAEHDLDTDVEVDAPATFVVASLGIYGVDAFTPIVMTPNVATLAIGRVRDATRWEGDHPTRASAMTLTLAWDHRAVDGTTAAEFLAEVRDILEQPYRLLVD